MLRSSTTATISLVAPLVSTAVVVNPAVTPLTMAERRTAFTKLLPVGKDEQKVPEFYNVVKQEFKFEKKPKIAVILVAHFVHTLPHFLEVLDSLFDIAIVIPKQSRVVKRVRETIERLYGDIIPKNVNKKNLGEQPEIAESFFSELCANKKWQGYQFIILDHGGYFAPRIEDVLARFKKRIIGVVEHTWNGQIKYEEQLKRHKAFPFPILSIARSPLKDLESDPVARSIVDAINYKVYSGKGLNQDITKLECILIIGYGHIGRAVAKALGKKFDYPRDKEVIYICDSSDGAQTEAKRFFLEKQVTGNKHEFLSKADLIITATSSQVLTKEDFLMLKPGAVIACATSNDDQFTTDALGDYEILTESAPVKYQHKKNPKKFFHLVANGDAVNFSIGSTSDPIIYIILALICVNAQRLTVTSSRWALTEIHSSSKKNDDERIKKIYERFFKLNIDAQLLKIADQLKAHYRESCDEKRFIADIKAHYQKRNLIVNGFSSPLAIEKCYVNLAIVREEDQRKKEWLNLLERKSTDDNGSQNEEHIFIDRRISSYEEIYGTNDPITVERIFKDPTTQRVLILGRAGIGKSTVCQYIVYRWACDKLWQEKFHLIVWVQLRKLLDYPDTEATIADVIYKECLTENESGEKLFSREFIKENLERLAGNILYVLDGYDEVAQIANSKTAKGKLVLQLLEKTQVIITSRPYSINNYLAKYPKDEKLESIGFLDPDIDKFIANFYKSNKNSQDLELSLKKILQQSPSIRGIAHIPINLAMLCQTWLRLSEQMKVTSGEPITMTRLYDWLFTDLCIHNLWDVVNGENPPSTWPDEILAEERCQPILLFHERIAFLQMQKDSLVIAPEIIAKYKPKGKQLAIFLKLGLLRSLDIEKSVQEDDRKGYYFVHLTFQEYFAARYIAAQLRLKNEDIFKFIELHKFIPKFEIVWWFVAGLLKADQEYLNYFFEILSNNSLEDYGSERQCLLVRCLEECDLLLSSHKQIPLLHGISQWIGSVVIQESTSKSLRYLALSPTVFNYDIIQNKFLELLNNDQNSVKIDATWILGKQPFLSDRVLKKFCDLLCDRDQYVQYAASWALETYALLPKKLFECLFALFRNTNELVRNAAARIIKKHMIVNNELILAKMEEFISDTDERVVLSALKILEKQKYLPDSLIKKLLSLINISFIKFGYLTNESIDLNRELNEPAIFTLTEAGNMEDSFFDAIAQALNRRQNSSEYDVKALRMLCSQYIVSLDKHCGNNPRHVDNWLGDQLGDKYQQYMSNISYTRDEREASEGLGTDKQVVRGEPFREGRIFCQTFNIKIFITDVENLKDRMDRKERSVLYGTLVTANEFSISSKLNEDSEDCNTIYLTAYKSYFIPLLSTFNLKPHVKSSVGNFETFREKVSLSSEDHSPISCQIILNDVQGELLIATFQVLEKQASLHSVILGRLVDFLGDRRKEVIHFASKMLTQQPQLDDSIIQKLVNLLNKGSEKVKETAAWLIQMQPTLSELIIQELLQVSEVSSRNVSDILRVGQKNRQKQLI